jgi:DNA-binding CsgD family transcriptional regulator
VEDPEGLTGTSYQALLLLALRAADAADDDAFRELGAAAIRAAAAADDPGTSAAAVQVMVRALSSGGFERDALDVVSAELERLAGQHTPAAALVLSTHADAVGAMAEVRAEPWDLASVADELDRAREMARATRDWYAEHRSLVGTAQTLGPYLPGRFDAAVSALLRLTEPPDRLKARGTTHAVAAYVPYLCGDFTGTAAALDRWRSFTADAGAAPLDWASLWAMSLHLDVWSGRIGAALRQIQQVDLRDHEAAPNILTWLVALSGDPLRWTGETDRALERAEFAVEVSPRGFATMPVAAELAASRAAAGAGPHHVLAAARGVGASFGSRNWHVYVPRLVEAVTAAADDGPVDDDLVADLDAFVGRLERYVDWLPHDAPVRPWATACLQRARAERAFLVGTPDPTLWDPVVADYDRRGGVPHAARARLRRATARAAAGGGSSPACERDLRTALRTFDELALSALADEGRSLARRLRIRVSRPGRPDGSEGLAELTDRELDVVRLVARGWTNRQVGEHLFISPKTVSTHLSNLMRKLDVGSRTEAVLVARDAGLVDGS